MKRYLNRRVITEDELELATANETLKHPFKWGPSGIIEGGIYYEARDYNGNYIEFIVVNQETYDSINV